MRRILFHALLAIALVLQGLGPACASGGMANATGNTMPAAADMAVAAESCGDSNGCSGCGGDRMSAQDCMQRCAMPASITSLPPVELHEQFRGPLMSPSAMSLVEYHQVPPTPPPIA